METTRTNCKNNLPVSHGRTRPCPKLDKSYAGEFARIRSKKLYLKLFRLFSIIVRKKLEQLQGQLANGVRVKALSKITFTQPIGERTCVIQLVPAALTRRMGGERDTACLREISALRVAVGRLDNRWVNAKLGIGFSFPRALAR